MICKRQDMKRSLNNNYGFTMIEIIAILVIVGIMGAFVISRVLNIDDIKSHNELDMLKSNLRYAQYRALNDIPPVKWGIRINGNSYTLIRNSSGDGATFDSPYMLPSESSTTHSLAPFTATQVNVLFDEFGIPYLSANKLTADATINLGSKSLIVKAETGFIP